MVPCSPVGTQRGSTQANGSATASSILNRKVDRIVTDAISSSGMKVRTDTPLGSMIVARGYTAIKLCTVTGIHPRTMTNYISGVGRPTRDHTILLCRTLACLPEDIIRAEAFHPDLKE